MTKKKATKYDNFMARVLADLANNNTWFTREKYVNWSMVAKDTRARNEELRVLHKVMNDLVKIGVLTRGKRPSRSITWYSRVCVSLDDV